MTKKTIEITGGTNTGISQVLPIGEQPEGNLDALGKLEEATKKLFANLDRLGENIKKLKEENKRLRELCGITVSEEPLILTPDMEVKDGHK